jgi:hypothetical protein
MQGGFSQTAPPKAEGVIIGKIEKKVRGLCRSPARNAAPENELIRASTNGARHAPSTASHQ